MSPRSRVDNRAQLIYNYLRDNLNSLYTFDELMEATGLNDSATTRASIGRASALAEDDGLCMPIACPANGFTYCVTDDPAAVVDSSMHLGSIAAGVGVRKDVHDEFMQSRMAQLSAAERKLLHSLQELEQSTKAQRDAQRSVLQTVVAMRRESRNSGADE